MTQLSILNGIYADGASRLRSSYPVNLEPVIMPNGVSNGQLRSAAGIAHLGTGPGPDRGATVFQSVHYRVMGAQFCKVVGNVVYPLADVGSGPPTPMAGGFTYLGVLSGGRFYLYNATAGMQQVTDVDLGLVIDVIWVDGYYMLTDGTSLIVTELNDPFSIDPLKYGASEADPDPITGLMKVRNQVYAVNRYTIENFYNAGTTGFPFARNQGGFIPKGSVGTNAKAYFLDTFAFVGSGHNEGIGVYLTGNGEAIPLSTPEIARELAALSDADLANVECEARAERAEQRLYVHLPDKTLVYSRQASIAAQEPVWHKLAGGPLGNETYPVRHFTLQEGQWFCGSPIGELGVLDETISTLFGVTAGWSFDTSFVYNQSRGAILQGIELVALPGSAPLGESPVAFMSVTRDGKTWSQERAICAGAFGQSGQRLQWRPGIRFANYMGCRFRGADTSIASFLRLEADFEPLNV